jgi:phosphoribosylformylglycinamidine synthase subunit PurL
VGGNVSLYNESRGRDIDPTPVVAVVGVIDQLEQVPPGPALVEGGALVLLGADTRSLSGSRWAWERGHRRGAPPELDLVAHRRVCDLVRRTVSDGLAEGVHDTADGLGVALSEMAVGSGVGFAVEDERSSLDHAWLFAESPSRVVVCTAADRSAELLRSAEEAGVPARVIGRAGGDRLVVPGLVDVTVADAVAAWREHVPAAMAAGATH